LKKLENSKLRGPEKSSPDGRTPPTAEEEPTDQDQLANEQDSKVQAMIEEGMIHSEENAILTQVSQTSMPPPSTQSTVLDEGASTSKSIRKKRKKSLGMRTRSSRASTSTKN
ncbi:hypothetical protein V2J09_016200, partial [Rumex salicifolius]